MRTSRSFGFKAISTRQKGFTLIEVLVTAVVLSVGLLGLAGLQTVSMRNNHSAYLRSQAVHLAYDIADRVRSNAKYQAKFNGLSAAATTACTATAGCDETAMAKNDLYQWQNYVTAMLPSAESVICRDSSPDDGNNASSPACDGNGSDYAVKIWWNDDRTGAATNQRFVMSFRP